MHKKINKPTVFIIGAAKSGTTSLASLLIAHPDLDIGTTKEPEYFSFSFSKGEKFYLDQFSAPSKREKILIDASTGYTRYPQYPEVAKRLHDFEPNAKLIYLMRHPIDRAYSHYVHRYTKELRKNEPINVSFEEHIKADTMCVESSDYKSQIDEYMRFFSPDQLLMLFTQDLEDRPHYVLDEACRFIGVDPELIEKSQFVRKNKTDSYLESRVRVSLTNRLKLIPGVSSLVSVAPKSLKDKIYGLLRRSPIGKSSERKFTPKPMHQNTRSELLRRFKESNSWVGKVCNRDMSDWNN